MDKARKKNIKRVIALICIFAVVAVLAAMPLIAKQDPEEQGPKASILSGSVSTGSIDKELIGGGTLAEENAVTISIPSAVKLESFLVSNGETVTEGTAIASVDRVTVMTAISQVQETLEYLSEQINETSDTEEEVPVSALAGGTVKILYAEEGASVQNVMLGHGALAVLSLDGLMAVAMETESSLPVGTEVTVTLSDGTAVTGKITRNLAGEMTVTVEDDGYAVGDPVEVTAEDGTVISSGELYIHSPWNATAYTGIIDSIEVSVGDRLEAGDTLMVLRDVGHSAAYRQLVGQRQAYEELMLELFRMYQTETITAPCDGVVSGIDEGSVQLLSAGGQGYSISFLSNVPDGEDAPPYTDHAGQVTGISAECWELNIDPQPIIVGDREALYDVQPDTTLMTQPIVFDPADTPIYTFSESTWVQIDRGQIGVGDILLFTLDTDGSLVWIILLQEADQPELPDDPSEPTDPSVPDESEQPTDPSVPDESEQPTDPSVPDESEQPTEPTAPGGSELPTDPSVPGGSELPTDPSFPGGSVQPTCPMSSGGSSGFPDGFGSTYPSGGNGLSGGSGLSGGDLGGMGMPEQAPVFELYGLDMATIASVTPQDHMTMEITVDELDINALQVGMTAQVKIDALGGEKCTATITEIGNVGTNNGGNSKYTVVLTMDRAEDMLSGMNASATIVLSTVSDVLTVPADAIVERGNQTIIYTGYDEEEDTLLDPVTVTIGSSDGKTVQILEGLAEGQTYYYAYFDTLEISFTPDFGGGMPMFG